MTAGFLPPSLECTHQAGRISILGAAHAGGLGSGCSDFNRPASDSPPILKCTHKTGLLDPDKEAVVE